jgi:hypothetical protein
MDLIRLLKSLEELIYELVGWLMFYPLTMWRSIVAPQGMMRYAQSELLDKEQDQFTDTLSPPLFLWVTLFIANLLNNALVKRGAAAKVPSLLANDVNLVIFRAILFSVLPLLFAAKVLRHRKVQLDRVPLKAPFYSQCFIAAPFALGIEISLVLYQLHKHPFGIAGAALFLLCLGWYLLVEARWFSDQLGISRLRALGRAVITMLEGVVTIIVLALIVGIGMRGV